MPVANFSLCQIFLFFCCYILHVSFYSSFLLLILVLFSLFTFTLLKSLNSFLHFHNFPPSSWFTFLTLPVIIIPGVCNILLPSCFLWSAPPFISSPSFLISLPFPLPPPSVHPRIFFHLRSLTYSLHLYFYPHPPLKVGQCSCHVGSWRSLQRPCCPPCPGLGWLAETCEAWTQL